MRQLYSVLHNLRTNDETAIQHVAQSKLRTNDETAIQCVAQSEDK